MIELVDIETARPTKPGDLIPRHKGNGSPKIFPEDQAGLPNPKGTFYTRMTTFIDALDDKSSLADWKLRMLLEGIHRKPSLMHDYADLAEPLDGEKSKALAIARRGLDAADADFKAELGTALHELTEEYDLTGQVAFVPDEYEKDIAAYVQAVQGLGVASVEEFVVNDFLKAAGTFDRLYVIEGDWEEKVGLPEGTPIIGDVKTGRIDLARGKFGMQFSGYAMSNRYDPVTYERSLIEVNGVPVSLDKALLIHLPAGEGECTVIPVDIRRGWEDVLLAKQVREYRSYWGRKESAWEPIAQVSL